MREADGDAVMIGGARAGWSAQRSESALTRSRASVVKPVRDKTPNVIGAAQAIPGRAASQRTDEYTDPLALDGAEGVFIGGVVAYVNRRTAGQGGATSQPPHSGTLVPITWRAQLKNGFSPHDAQPALCRRNGELRSKRGQPAAAIRRGHEPIVDAGGRSLPLDQDARRRVGFDRGQQALQLARPLRRKRRVEPDPGS